MTSSSSFARATSRESSRSGRPLPTGPRSPPRRESRLRTPSTARYGTELNCSSGNPRRDRSFSLTAIGFRFSRRLALHYKPTIRSLAAGPRRAYSFGGSSSARPRIGQHHRDFQLHNTFTYLLAAPSPTTLLASSSAVPDRASQPPGPRHSTRQGNRYFQHANVSQLHRTEAAPGEVPTTMST